jgi:hypothetical protein
MKEYMKMERGAMYSMRLYHGSNKIINEPKYNGSRDKTDFGRGFYLTANEEQARRWSIKGDINIVNCYDVELENLNVCKLELGLEWLLFIIYNRKVGNFDFEKLRLRFSFLENVDVIIGPTADDRMYNTLEEFFDGDISIEKTLDILSCMELSDQYLIKTSNGIKNILHTGNYLLSGTLLEQVLNEDKTFFNAIKYKVKLYQRRNYDNETYIEQIQEVVNNVLKC